MSAQSQPLSEFRNEPMADFSNPANRRAMPSADYAQWPKPAEIAQVILFLCSGGARLIHGAAIPVYGRT